MPQQLCTVTARGVPTLGPRALLYKKSYYPDQDLYSPVLKTFKF